MLPRMLLRRSVWSMVLTVASLFATTAHAQDISELLLGISASEQGAIRSACYGAGLSGPASFNRCVKTKADELRRSAGQPDLSGLPLSEQTSIRSACYGAGLSGPASLYACMRRKAAELSSSAGAPDLAEFSVAEQASMTSACYGASLSGPASLYACLRRKAGELRASPDAPNLEGFSVSEQNSLRSACYGASLSGPASFYSCLRRKSDELRNSPGEPDLARFSASTQASLRSACYGASLAGPASYYSCLRSKASALEPVKAVRSFPDAPTLTNSDVASPLSPSVLVDAAPDTESPLLRLDGVRLTPAPDAERRPTSLDLGTANPSRTRAEAVGSESPAPSQDSSAKSAPQSVAPRINSLTTRPASIPRTGPAQTATNDSGVMWLLLLLVVGLVIGVRVARQQRLPPEASATTGPGQQGGGTPTSAPSHTYRPIPSRQNSRVKFGSSSARPVTGQIPEMQYADLRDAVTGQALAGAKNLFRCGTCQVFYQAASVEFIRAENQGLCVACGHSSIELVSGSAPQQPAGRNYEAGVTTLGDYRTKVGQVVIFEGRCLEVRQSSRGSDYAVMFENATWSRGFKMVVMRAAVTRVGGSEFIKSLSGKHIRLRGLIVKHPRFGYEILVNDRSMILAVRS